MEMGPGIHNTFHPGRARSSVPSDANWKVAPKDILKEDVHDGRAVAVNLRDGKFVFGGLTATKGGQAQSAKGWLWWVRGL
ncbi:MAG: hypothetical protein ACHQZQ_03870 [SAR324 cluster bacterium]